MHIDLLVLISELEHNVPLPVHFILNDGVKLMKFTDPNALSVLEKSHEKILKLVSSEKSTRASRDLVANFLVILIRNPGLIDDNISNVSEGIIPEFINKISEPIVTDDDINIIFSLVYRVVMDVGILGEDAELEPFFDACKKHALDNYSSFDSVTKSQIDYVNRSLPIDIIKNITNSKAFRFYQQVSSQFETIKEKEKEWSDYIKEQQDKVNNLHDQLVNKENNYNFVGLIDGFRKISDEKKKELFWARLAMFFFGLVMLSFSVFDVFYLGLRTHSLDVINNLFRLIPYLTLMIIIIYFFRVSLFNFRSIKAQMTQLSLRMSLCQFIQSYADYAKEISNDKKDLLVRFENIIFSNIVVTEENIPSTYDGLEQLATMIGNLKKK